MATTLTIRFKSVMAGLRQTRKRYKASDHLREHIARFNKSVPELVKIDPVLNDFMMSRVVKGGSKVKVEITKVGDLINAKLAPGQMPVKPEPQTKAAAAPSSQKSQSAVKSSDVKPNEKAAKQPKSPSKPKAERREQSTAQPTPAGK